jgi:hypothetical protein
MIKNIVCFFVVISTNTFAQLHHQTIGAGGGSSNNGVVFSVGQASVVGNHFAQGYSINQGFVQPIEGSYHFKPNGDSLHVTVYPNPFVESFSAEFDKKYPSISLTVETILGQYIFSDVFFNTSKINVKIGALAAQAYLVTIRADNKVFVAKLIKTSL